MFPEIPDIFPKYLACSISWKYPKYFLNIFLYWPDTLLVRRECETSEVSASATLFNGYNIVKLYMKYFLYWTANVKSSQLWSSQLLRVYIVSRCIEKLRTSTRSEPVTSRHRCDALTNYAMKPQLYYICWTADGKSSKLWTSQLWTQCLQLRIHKSENCRTSTGFEPVTSRHRRSN